MAQQQANQTIKKAYSSGIQGERSSLINQSTTSKNYSLDKEYSDQEVKDIFYKEQMDGLKKHLVWFEKLQKFLVKDKNGNFVGQYTVAGLRKLAKEQTEKEVTPEYITKFKERNKKKTELKRNIQRLKSQKESRYQRINTKLEENRQLAKDIDEIRDGIEKLNEKAHELNKEMLEHTKYLYKIESKAAERLSTVEQRNAENTLAVEQAERSAIQSVVTRDFNTTQINLQLKALADQKKQHEDAMNVQLASLRLQQKTNRDFNDQSAKNRAHQEAIFSETMRHQYNIAGQQNEIANEFLKRQTDLSDKLTDGLSDIAATIRDNAATNAAAITELAGQQADAAAKAQKQIEEAIKASAPAITNPEDIKRLCRGNCSAGYDWVEWRLNCTSKLTGQTGITIWNCKPGGHWCASDVGSIERYERQNYQ